MCVLSITVSVCLIPDPGRHLQPRQLTFQPRQPDTPRFQLIRLAVCDIGQSVVVDLVQSSSSGPPSPPPPPPPPPPPSPLLMITARSSAQIISHHVADAASL